MKSFVHLSLCLCLLLTSALSTAQMNAEEMLPGNLSMREKEGNFIELKAAPISLKNSGDKIHALDYRLVDSLANLFSYFSDRTQPFIYERESGTLITIKRGWVDLLITPGYTGDNTKNNIFVRKSSDLGLTWDDPIKVYDEKAYKMGEGRYPSVTAFMLDEELILAYNIPSVNETASTWNGFICGFWSESLGEINALSRDLRKSGTIYNWGTDSRLIGGIKNDNPYAFALGTVSSTNDPADNNNIAYRKSNDDLDAWDGVIPDQWSSSRFVSVDDLNSRFNESVDIQMGPNDKIYVAAFGNFVAGEVANRNVPGVSISDDFGQTWSEFDIFPNSIFENYLVQKGVHKDSARFSWESKGFLVHPNGDFSFVLQAYQITGDQTIPTQTLLRDIVEVYKENGVWGIRKIAENSLYMVFTDNTNDDGDRVNPLNTELQLTRTEDGQTLVAKWIGLLGLDWEQSTFSYNDVYISYRKLGKDNWSDTINVTNDVDIDRSIWLPDYLPNDLTNIPLLKLWSVPAEGDTPEQIRSKQFECKIPQYLLAANFNIFVSVEEQEEVISNFNFLGIYPNPASDKAEINFELTGDANVTIEIYNLLGSKVLDVHSGYIGSGLKSVPVSTVGLAAGMYQVIINADNQKYTRLLNIVR